MLVALPPLSRTPPWLVNYETKLQLQLLLLPLTLPTVRICISLPPFLLSLFFSPPPLPHLIYAIQFIKLRIFVICSMSCTAIRAAATPRRLRISLMSLCISSFYYFFSCSFLLVCCCSSCSSCSHFLGNFCQTVINFLMLHKKFGIPPTTSLSLSPLLLPLSPPSSCCCCFSAASLTPMAKVLAYKFMQKNLRI